MIFFTLSHYLSDERASLQFLSKYLPGGVTQMQQAGRVTPDVTPRLTAGSCN